jgi:hypothetical protein
LLLMLAAVLHVAGTPARTLGAALAIAGILGTAAIYLEPYRRARFFAFLHPWQDAQGTGYQIAQAMIGMGSGHFFGVGIATASEALLPPGGTHGHDPSFIGGGSGSSATPRGLPHTRSSPTLGLEIGFTLRCVLRQAPCHWAHKRSSARRRRSTLRP